MPTPTNFIIPVSNGLLARWKKIKQAIWVLLWFMDRVTREVQSDTPNQFDGLVLGGAPVTARRIAEELQANPRTIHAHIDRLCSKGCVRRIERGPGEPFGYVVRDSKKKWLRQPPVASPGTAENLRAFADKQQRVAEQQHASAENLQPNNEDSTGTIQRQEYISPKPPASADPALVEALNGVWEYYLEVTQRDPRLYTFTLARRAKGMVRLRECMKRTGGDAGKAAELMQVCIDEMSKSDFHMGRDPKTSGKKYCDWEHLFGSTERMEKWWLQ